MVTLVAIGILVILVPWAVEALGFGELGPIEGKLFLHTMVLSKHCLLTWLRIVCCVVAVDIPRGRGWILLLVAAEARYEVRKEMRRNRALRRMQNGIAFRSSHHEVGTTRKRGEKRNLLRVD